MGFAITVCLASIGVFLTTSFGLVASMRIPFMRRQCHYADMPQSQRAHFWNMLLLTFLPMLLYAFTILFIALW